MPPPKKPKRGPTSADQFLSAEELSGLRTQRLPSSASESSDTVSGRNSSPPISVDEPMRDQDDQIQPGERVGHYVHNQASNSDGDIPMNLSSSNHTSVVVEGRRTATLNLTRLDESSRTSVVFSTSSYVSGGPQNPEIESGLAVPKTEPGLGLSEPEHPVLQKVAETASPVAYQPPRYASPTQAVAPPTHARHPPHHLLPPRHQSPMLTLMMAVPTSRALWQPALSMHDTNPHSPPHFTLPLASLDNKMLPHPHAQPHDFSKRGSGRSSDGSGRKRKPRYSLLSAALSGASTSTSVHNTTVSTSAPNSRTATREHLSKHTIDLLRSNVPSSAALLRLSSTVSSELLHTSTVNHSTSAEHLHTSTQQSHTSTNHSHTSAEPSHTSVEHQTADALRTSYVNTSDPNYLRTLHPTLHLYQPLLNSSEENMANTNSSSNSAIGHGNDNGSRTVASLLNMAPRNNGVTMPPLSARLMGAEQELPPPSPDSPVFTEPRLTDKAGSESREVSASISSRVSTETMTSSHTGSTSSCLSFQMDDSRDGCVSDASRRDNSRNGDGAEGASPMQSPISSTSLSGTATSLPPVSSSHHHDDRLSVNGSSSSIDAEIASSVMAGLDVSFGDPTKVICKQEDQLPGSSCGSGVSRQCQVCNDGASGFHYGVWSCEGCKAFFKRSIQGPVDYICPATNNCTIDKHRRKSCQACRLRKCYEVGMTKGTSQRKERRSSSTSSNNTPTAGRPRKRQRPDGTVMTNGTKAKRLGHMATVVLDALIQADTPILESFHDHSLPPSKIHLLSSLLKLVDRELVYLINWAKHVQGYTDLVLCDQVHLIECCWMELLLLSCAFRSIEYQGKQLVFASDLILDRQVWYLLDMVDVLEQVAAISAQMAFFNVHKEELLLLKALSLTNAEVRQLSNPGLLSNMRSNLIEALTTTAQKHHAQSWGYVPSLMLLLAHVRQASLQTISHLQKLKHEGIVPFCDLLKEMLEAQSLPSDEKSALNQCG